MSQGLTTADGMPLKQALAAAEARAKRRAFILVMPLLLFILLTFVAPIGQMLLRSVYNPSFSQSAPNLSVWFENNPAGTEPDEAAFEALVLDLQKMREEKSQGEAGTRVNYDYSGARSLFTSTARKADKLEPPYKEAMLEADDEWSNPGLWQAMRGASSAYTLNFYLAALDLGRDENGKIVSVDENRAVYIKLFGRTLFLSALITMTTLILGFPIAHLLATLPLRYSNLLMIFVLLPFWTSLLVRTTSWIVLLQSQGVVNDVMVASGIVSESGRLQMIYNQTGTIIAMTSHSVAIHGSPSLFGDAPDQSKLCSCGTVSGGHQLDCLPTDLSAPDNSRHWCWRAVGLHLGSGLLHHPRAGWRIGRTADFEPHRLPHAEITQLVACGSLGCSASGRRSGALLALRPAGRN